MRLKPPYTYVGGKRKMVDFITESAPQTINTYYEPCLGGGAAAIRMMELHPETTFRLSDFNPEIPNVWNVIREHPNELTTDVQEHVDRHTKEYYLAIRNWDRRGILGNVSPVERAARFIYLCNGGFGGGYSLNPDGICINSFGREFISHDTQNTLNLSRLLNERDVQILTLPFQEALLNARAGDFVYLDPPYATDTDEGEVHDSYVKASDTGSLQKQIKRTIANLTSKGVYVLLSNSDTPTTRTLFEGWNKISRSVMWSGGEGKRINTEVLWGNHHLARLLRTDSALLIE